LTPEQEKQVIQKILAGDRTAFAQIVDAHEKQVYNLALRTLQNPEDAQDITQEVFLKVYSDIGSFRGDSRLSVWLYRVTYNLCIDLLRKQKRRPTVSLTYETEDGEEKEHAFGYTLGKEFTEKKEDGEEVTYRYVMLDHSDMLFHVNKQVIDGYLDYDLSEIAPLALCEMSFLQLREFTFTIDGETHTAIRETVDEETTCYYDGEEVNYGYVESFFLDMTKMQSEGGYNGEIPNGKPLAEAKFTIECYDELTDYTLEIYEYDANFCIGVFSGRQDMMLVSIRDVNLLQDSFEELTENVARRKNAT